MWRALVVVIAFDSASRADPCLPPAKYEAALAAVTKVNDARAAAVLAKRKLAIANLPHATWKAEHRKVDAPIDGLFLWVDERKLVVTQRARFRYSRRPEELRQIRIQPTKSP